jgi:hypothetical protein
MRGYIERILGTNRPFNCGLASVERSGVEAPPSVRNEKRIIQNGQWLLSQRQLTAATWGGHEIYWNKQFTV